MKFVTANTTTFQTDFYKYTIFFCLSAYLRATEKKLEQVPTLRFIRLTKVHIVLAITQLNLTKIVYSYVFINVMELNQNYLSICCKLHPRTGH